MSYTHHMTIFLRCKLIEGREFYIRLCIRESYSIRELDRQISSRLFDQCINRRQLAPFADSKLTTISIGLQIISSVIKICGEGST
ncbi:DUF1016 N-terminal domain-containing protein [Flavobacterium rivuli]|uniref:DUF1016 N-terminal domain-containing protein n=1 Tax=Flavobacterium rivuli TaxID=498301 RepID=UPI003CC80B4C